MTSCQAPDFQLDWAVFECNVFSKHPIFGGLMCLGAGRSKGTHPCQKQSTLQYLLNTYLILITYYSLTQVRHHKLWQNVTLKVEALHLKAKQPGGASTTIASIANSAVFACFWQKYFQKESINSYHPTGVLPTFLSTAIEKPQKKENRILRNTKKQKVFKNFPVSSFQQ